MISVDVGKSIHVVHHEPERLPQSWLRGVPHPVEPFQARAVGKMKSCDRIEGYVAPLRVKEVVRAQPGERSAELVANRLGAEGITAFELLGQARQCRRDVCSHGGIAAILQPLREAWNGGERRECLESS